MTTTITLADAFATIDRWALQIAARHRQAATNRATLARHRARRR